MDTVLYMIIPCYNEQETLPVSAPVFRQKLQSLIDRGVIGDKSRIMFVNDGSKDATWDMIRAIHEKDPHFTGVDLARNVGEQYAMLAGMFTAEPLADCIITMDCDLQDDINAVDVMLEEYHKGNDIVYGVRSDRSQDAFFERLAAESFYKLMKALKTGLIYEHANYRLMSKKALGLMREYPETNLYLPSMASLLGLKSSVITHERLPRASGTTGYSLQRRIRLAIDAIVSYSRAPLMALTAVCGLCLILTTVCLVCWIAACVKTGTAQTGLCILTSVWAAAALLSAALRLIGGYIYRTLMETKRRPRYQIDTVLG